MSVHYPYHAAVLEGLLAHGLRPLSTTPPQFLRDAVRDLYRYEIKALRAAFVAGRIPKAGYADRVIELRKRYWLLSVPLQLWTQGSGPGEPADVR